jgi:antitoxin VapB
VFIGTDLQQLFAQPVATPAPSHRLRVKEKLIDTHDDDTYHETYQNQKDSMFQTAKIFATGRSQAVRLPLEFRFDVPEVFIRHDPITGDVVLSRKPTDWQGLLDVVAQNKDEEFLLERRPTRARRDPFEGSEP